jgi:hypothetical protein
MIRIVIQYHCVFIHSEKNNLDLFDLRSITKEQKIKIT